MTTEPAHCADRQIRAWTDTVRPGWATILGRLHTDLVALAPGYQLDAFRAELVAVRSSARVAGGVVPARGEATRGVAGEQQERFGSGQVGGVGDAADLAGGDDGDEIAAGGDAVEVGGVASAAFVVQQALGGAQDAEGRTPRLRPPGRNPQRVRPSGRRAEPTTPTSTDATA